MMSITTWASTATGQRFCCHRKFQGSPFSQNQKQKMQKTKRNWAVFGNFDSRFSLNADPWKILHAYYEYNTRYLPITPGIGIQ